MILGQIVLATLLGGVASVLAAWLLAEVLRPLQRRLVGFAVGALLGAALLMILPEALESHVSAIEITGTVLASWAVLFMLEKLTLWRHAHVEPVAPAALGADAPMVASHGARTGHDESLQPAAYMVIVGDALHNFVDGVLLAAAFMTSPAVGWGATLAVVLHEVPQELGDFLLLREAGWSRRKAILLNGAASLAAVLGGIVGYSVLSGAQHIIPYVLAMAAASFLYIAVADLIPRLQRDCAPRDLATQLAAMGIGCLVVSLAHLGHSH